MRRLLLVLAVATAMGCPKKDPVVTTTEPDVTPGGFVDLDMGDDEEDLDQRKATSPPRRHGRTCRHEGEVLQTQAGQGLAPTGILPSAPAGFVNCL